MNTYTCDEIANITCGSVLYWGSNNIIEGFYNYPSPPFNHSLYFIKGQIPDQNSTLQKDGSR